MSGLILRGPRESDFDAFAAFGASDRAHWIGGPFSRHRSWGGFLATFGHWALRGYGMWMAEDRASGRTAGRIGMIFNDGWAEPELGWQIFDGFEGKGLAQEAARAARDHAARHFRLDGVISYIRAENTRSRALAERLGATHTTDFAHPKFGTLHLWRHPSPQDLSAGGVEAYS